MLVGPMACSMLGSKGCGGAESAYTQRFPLSSLFGRRVTVCHEALRRRAAELSSALASTESELEDARRPIADGCAKSEHGFVVVIVSNHGLAHARL